MSRVSLAAVLIGVTLGLPALAGASSVERVRVAGPGVTAAFPRGISLELASPPDYTRGAEGTWTGPDYWASGKRDAGGKASIRWSVDFQATSSSARSIALNAPRHRWPVDRKDPLSVPHFVGKRVVGTILGFYVITRSPGEFDAAYEAVLAFPVAPKAYSVVRFELAEPATDSAGEWGNYLVRGIDLASIWNRGQAFWALSGVKVLGNLPPTRVDLAATGRVLRGAVADAFRHPVLGVPVSIQRRKGTSWRRVTATKSDQKGAFALRASRGTYRAVATSRGKRAVSPAVFVD
jgi:hypothetical protein